MGRVLRREVVGIACNLRSCSRQVSVGPFPLEADWVDMLSTYERLVADGWGLILNDTLRSYCPAHQTTVWECSCRTRPEARGLCPEHSGDARDSVWTVTQIPAVVQDELARQGRSQILIGKNS